jgi:hypothetical protein
MRYGKFFQFGVKTHKKVRDRLLHTSTLDLHAVQQRGGA